MQRGKAREWVAWHVGEVCKAPMRRSAWLLGVFVRREPGLPVRALTCPTPNHYSIIYYRSSLWESKHRSHVTLCDRSNEGGDSSLSSSSSLLFSSSSSSSFSSPFFTSFIQLYVPPFTRRGGILVYVGRDFLARRTRRRDTTFILFENCAREINCEGRFVSGNDRWLAITQSPPRFRMHRETRVNRDTRRRVRNEQSIRYDA